MALGFVLFWLFQTPLLAQTNSGPSNAQERNQTGTLSGDGSADFTQARAGGSRGCALAAPPSDSIAAQSSLILLVNQPGSILRTRSPRPIFNWYVRDGGQWPLELRIYRQRPQAPIKEVLRLHDGQNFLSKQGIMTLTLPEHETPLESGERYLWQVVIQCEPDDPSSYLFATAHLEVVSDQSPTDLDAIATQNSPSVSHLFPPQEVSQLSSTHPEVLSQEQLNRWLKKRLQGQRSPSTFPWKHLGLSEAEALEMESSPIHSVDLPPTN